MIFPVVPPVIFPAFPGGLSDPEGTLARYVFLEYNKSGGLLRILLFRWRENYD